MPAIVRAVLVLGLFLALSAFFARGSTRFAATGIARGMSTSFAILAIWSAFAGLIWAYAQFFPRARR